MTSSRGKLTHYQANTIMIFSHWLKPKFMPFGQVLYFLYKDVTLLLLDLACIYFSFRVLPIILIILSFISKGSKLDHTPHPVVLSLPSFPYGEFLQSFLNSHDPNIFEDYGTSILRNDPQFEFIHCFLWWDSGYMSAWNFTEGMLCSSPCLLSGSTWFQLVPWLRMWALISWLRCFGQVPPQ